MEGLTSVSEHGNGAPVLGGAPSILICLLGSFQVVRSGQPLTLRGGGKAESLLTILALRAGEGMTRERLVEMLWPDADASLSTQSLNSLVYSLQRVLGPLPGRVPLVIQVGGWCRLNLEAGIGVDVVRFDELIAQGDALHARGEQGRAAEAYAAAVDLYRGDLQAGPDVQGLIERERVRARYLSVLSWLADLAYSMCEYDRCLEYVLRLLGSDACREDAHRLAMRCYVRRGERAQALRQFRLCASLLRAEFDAPPEPATLALFEQVRLNPGSV